MRTRTAAIGVAVLALTGAGFAVGATVGGPPPVEATAPTERPTATVTRQPLSLAETFTGTLGYGESFALPGQAAGTLTWLPEVGAVLEPGDVLYRVDERPTLWARGTLPMYRELSLGSEGVDVEQLEQLLLDAGHLSEDATPDDTFDATTRAAVRAWQEANGLERTGRLDPSQLIFLPHDAIRVAAAPRAGSPAQGGVLDVTLPDQFVSIDVRGSRKAAFEDDPTIEVETADGSRLGAVVESIEALPSQDDSGSQSFRVRLQLDSHANHEPGEVTVDVVDTLANDVLTVPIQALLALAEHGYAVEVVAADGTTQTRAVEIGAFAGGWVEVTGDIEAGDTVVVPA